MTLAEAKAYLRQRPTDLTAVQVLELLERMEGALKPFGDFAHVIDATEARWGTASPDDKTIHPGLNVGHFRAARALTHSQE